MKEIFNIFPDGYLPLYHGGNMQKDDSLCSYSAASVEEVLSLHEQGVIRDYIYFAVPKSKADIAAVIGKCRLVANSLQEIQDINAVALEHNKPGYLEDMGLRVVPSRFDDGMQMGIPEAMLPALAGKIKKMAGISVRLFCAGRNDGTDGCGFGRLFPRKLSDGQAHDHAAALQYVLLLPVRYIGRVGT